MIFFWLDPMYTAKNATSAIYILVPRYMRQNQQNPDKNASYINIYPHKNLRGGIGDLLSVTLIIIIIIYYI